MKNILISYFLLFPLFIFAQSEFWIEGQVKVRGEFRNGYQTFLPDTLTPIFFTQHRIRLSTGYEMEKVSFYISFQDVRVWGSAAPGAGTSNTFMLHQGWAKYKFSPLWSVKVGRQVWTYDEQRLIGASDWGMAAAAHDGLLLAYNNPEKGWRAELGAAYNANSASSTWTPYAVPGSYVTAQFLWLNKKWEKLSFSATVINAGYQSTLTNAVHFKLTAGGQVKGKFNNFDFLAEAYYQGGLNINNIPLNAYLAAVKLNYTIAQKFKIELGTDLLSGTNYKDAASSDNSFYAFAGTNHKFYGYMDYFYSNNKHGNAGLLNPYLGLHYLSEKLNISLRYHYFHSLQPIQNEGASLAHELDLTATYKVHPWVDLELGYSHLLGNQSLGSLKNSIYYNGIHNWAYIQVNFKGEFFRHKFEKKVLE